ncbi:PH domain-containing protein [Raineyella fluvialis]|uniref:PH domain-containing protein n=1 Tax=Raineyella fluvialis TaxID=2662261 RepID=A0A5Q2FDV8_9ACTN|nr:PH domain-containing protein [Raineyella fluvialis]QGF23634.1 PH domain-containing protein [Raineyella fluvialis]
MSRTEVSASTADLFAGPGVAWRGIDRRWRTLSWLASALLAVVVGVPAAVAVWLLLGEPALAALPVGVAAVAWLWNAVLVHRRWPRWGYAETADELWVRRGVMFRALTVVPYGRLQVIDVNAGPLERLFGLATVTLVTASAQTDARIPGLPAAEAARLRDTLTAHSDPRRSGL